MRNTILTGLTLFLLAGCSSQTDAPDNQATGNAAASPPLPIVNEAAPAPVTSLAPPRPAPPSASPVEPPAPGTPGGLRDDRRPVSEPPFAATSAQAAADVVQTYYALIGEKKYKEAWRLWGGGGEASGTKAAAFAASFDKYAQYSAQIGTPGEIEGAAGSSYVEVPVIIYGRLKSGKEVHMKGPVTLRRVNDVPGSTAEQRQWHIQASPVAPLPH